MQNAERRVQNAECRVQNEFGFRISEFGGENIVGEGFPLPFKRVVIIVGVGVPDDPP